MKTKTDKIIDKWFESRALCPEDSEWKMIEDKDIEELKQSINRK